MKRWITLLLVFLMLGSLSGCGEKRVEFQEQVVFYYLRSDIQADSTFGDADSVITPEVQESLSRNNNLAYYLKLYLTGPTDVRLYSPFPKDLRLISIQYDHTVLIITFSDVFTQLTAMDRTTACACLAMTCFNLTDAQTISIQTESESVENQILINISREDLILKDLTTLDEDGG